MPNFRNLLVLPRAAIKHLEKTFVDCKDTAESVFIRCLEIQKSEKNKEVRRSNQVILTARFSQYHGAGPKASFSTEVFPKHQKSLIKHNTHPFTKYHVISWKILGQKARNSRFSKCEFSNSPPSPTQHLLRIFCKIPCLRYNKVYFSQNSTIS